MKITQEKLRQIIKEELEEILGDRTNVMTGEPRSKEINVALGREPQLPPEKPILSPQLKALILKLRNVKDPKSKAGSPLSSTWALSSALAGNQDAKKQFRPDPFNMPGNYKLEDVMNTAGLSDEEKELIRKSLI